MVIQMSGGLPPYLWATLQDCMARWGLQPWLRCKVSLVMPSYPALRRMPSTTSKSLRDRSEAITWSRRAGANDLDLPLPGPCQIGKIRNLIEPALWRIYSVHLRRAAPGKMA